MLFVLNETKSLKQPEILFVALEKYINSFVGESRSLANEEVLNFVEDSRQVFEAVVHLFDKVFDGLFICVSFLRV